MAGFRDLFGLGEEAPEAANDGDSELLTSDDEWRHPQFQRIRETPTDDF